MRITIYKRNNDAQIEVYPTKTPTCYRQGSGENNVNIEFIIPYLQELQAGDYIMLEGDKYMIEEAPAPKKISDNNYLYEVTFYGMERCLRYMQIPPVTVGKLRSDYSFNGTILEHVNRLMDTMSRLGMPVKLGTVVDTDQHKTINYKGLTCYEAATLIAETYGVGWGFKDGLFHMNTFEQTRTIPKMIMYFKGDIPPDSNIPFLVCGGEVNSGGNLVRSIGDTAKARRNSTGVYVITLPEYMKGDDAYIVTLSALTSDNYATRMGVDTVANCFWVNVWQSPGKVEDAAFTFTVYKANKVY